MSYENALLGASLKLQLSEKKYFSRAQKCTAPSIWEPGQTMNNVSWTQNADLVDKVSLKGLLMAIILAI